MMVGSSLRYFLIIGAVLYCPITMAADFVCKSSPVLTGQCSVMHGILNLSADAGEVLWLENPKRSIVIRAADDGDQDMPEELLKIFDKDFRSNIEGDFEVCPIQPKELPANSVFGCINSASHVMVKKNDD